MKKYKLLKKFCDEQVEEVGHVFEGIEFTYTYIKEERFAGYVPPHEIPLLINAGYLEEVKEVNFEDARWKEGEIKICDKYYCVLAYGATATVSCYTFNEDSGDIFRLKTKNCFKTEEAVQAYYESIVGKE